MSEFLKVCHPRGHSSMHAVSYNHFLLHYLSHKEPAKKASPVEQGIMHPYS